MAAVNLIMGCYVVLIWYTFRKAKIVSILSQHVLHASAVKNSSYLECAGYVYFYLECLLHGIFDDSKRNLSWSC